jgi:hypothetical protein
MGNLSLTQQQQEGFWEIWYEEQKSRICKPDLARISGWFLVRLLALAITTLSLSMPSCPRLYFAKLHSKHWICSAQLLRAFLTLQHLFV